MVFNSRCHIGLPAQGPGSNFLLPQPWEALVVSQILALKSSWEGREPVLFLTSGRPSSKFNRWNRLGSEEAVEDKVIMPANSHANRASILEPQHPSQWKPVRNQQAIQRYVPDAYLLFAPTHTVDREMLYRSDGLSKVHQFQRLNLSHHMLVREHVGRAGVGIESGRDEFQEEDETARLEIEGRLEGRHEAGSKAIGAAASHRGSDDFLASCMVC